MWTTKTPHTLTKHTMLPSSLVTAFSSNHFNLSPFHSSGSLHDVPTYMLNFIWHTLYTSLPPWHWSSPGRCPGSSRLGSDVISFVKLSPISKMKDKSRSCRKGIWVLGSAGGWKWETTLAWALLKSPVSVRHKYVVGKKKTLSKKIKWIQEIKDKLKM